MPFAMLPNPAAHLQLRSAVREQSSFCAVPVPHAVHATHPPPPAFAANVLCSSHALHVRSAALPPSASYPAEHWHFRFVVRVHSLTVSLPEPHFEHAAHAAPPTEYDFPATHATHLFVHLPFVLSHGTDSELVSPKPSLQRQRPALSFAALLGHFAALASLQAESSVLSEYFGATHASHEPPALTPLPCGHDAFAPHSLMSSVLLSVPLAHVSHSKSLVALPDPAFRPCPAGQLRHGVHAHFVAEFEYCCPEHGLHVLVPSPLKRSKPSLQRHCVSASRVHDLSDTELAPHVLQARHAFPSGENASLAHAAHVLVVVPLNLL